MEPIQSNVQKIRVRFDTDNTYAVVEIREDLNGFGFEIVLFTGSLADCESYIRLSREGLI